LKSRTWVDPLIRKSTAVIYANALGNRGGTGVYLRRLLEGFESCSADVLAASGGQLVKPAEALRNPNTMGKLGKLFAENFTLPAITASIAPSIVHLPAFSGRTPSSVPYAVTLHDLAFCRNSSWFPFFKSLYYRFRFKKVARRADAVIVDSEFTAAEAVELLGIEGKRIRRVYLSTGSFLSDTGPFRRRFALNGRYIVYAGTIEPRKNIAALVDSWGVVSSIHKDLHLVLAGRWGWGSGKLRKKLMNTANVLMTGPLEDRMMKSCITGAELLVYPSLYEGFGLPPLEAASAGTPSVITPASALMEIYSEVSTVTEGFDSRSITESILDTLETPCDVNKLKEFAAAFTNERMAIEVLEVYREFGR
jgi:glycosyltransferase involved in cell wall biosynthesis